MEYPSAKPRREQRRLTLGQRALLLGALAVLLVIAGVFFLHGWGPKTTETVLPYSATLDVAPGQTGFVLSVDPVGCNSYSALATTAIQITGADLSYDVGTYVVHHKNGSCRDNTGPRAFAPVPSEWLHSSATTSHRVVFRLRDQVNTYVLTVTAHQVRIVGESVRKVSPASWSVHKTGHPQTSALTSDDEGLTFLRCSTAVSVTHDQMATWAFAHGMAPADLVFADVEQDVDDGLYVLTTPTAEQEAGAARPTRYSEPPRGVICTTVPRRF